MFRLSAAALLFSGCSRQPGRPDQIVFQSNRDGNFEIYAMNNDGTGQRRLTDSPLNDIAPAISPDGTTVVFASDRSGNWEIYSIGADNAGEPRKLTSGQGANTSPSWVPGGTKILFVSTRDAINGEIYRINPDGTGVERLTHDNVVKDTPVMSRDGSTIFFTATVRGRTAVASVPAAGGEVALLTAADYNSAYPAVSPDGSTIAFASDRSGQSQIYTMEPHGLKQTRVTLDSSNDTEPWWMPGSGTLLFSRHGSIVRLSLADHRETVLSFKGDSRPRCGEKE